MPISQVIQIALSISKMVRDLIGQIPADQLTDEQKQELRTEANALNDAWAALAPQDQ